MTHNRHEVIELAEATSVQHAFDHYQPSGPSARTIYRWLETAPPRAVVGLTLIDHPPEEEGEVGELLPCRGRAVAVEV